MVHIILVTFIALLTRAIAGSELAAWNSSQIFTLRNQKIHLAVLLPSKPIDESSERSTQILATTLPVIELAIKAVEEKRILEGVQLKINFR